MTTIAVDARRGLIGADCMATSNDCDVAIPCKKISRVFSDDWQGWVASSGNEAPALMVETWLQGTADQPDFTSIDDEDSFTTVILTDEREIWLVDKFCYPYMIYSDFYATGTGGSFAWAILEAGLELEAALEVAIRLDPHSGMGVQIERV